MYYVGTSYRSMWLESSSGTQATPGRVGGTKGRLSWVGHSLKHEHATRLAFGQLSGVADESSETRPCASHELPGPEPAIAVRLQEDEAPPRGQRRGLGGEGRS